MNEEKISATLRKYHDMNVFRFIQGVGHQQSFQSHYSKMNLLQKLTAFLLVPRPARLDVRRKIYHYQVQDCRVPLSYHLEQE